MPVDHFTREQFEAALPRHKTTGEVLHTPPVVENGQYVYTLPVSAHSGLRLYSGIGSNGLSAGCGKDSIRVIIIRLSDGKVYGSKLQRWVTRQAGWAGRLTGLLREMWKLAGKCGPCCASVWRDKTDLCGGFWGVYRVKKAGENKGRLFRRCDGQCGGWQWLTEGKHEAD